MIGENLIDLLVSSDGTVNATVGGGPLNVARCIGLLGGEAHFFSGVSADAFGRLIRTSLLESRVILDSREIKSQPTTLAVVELTAAGPRYHFHLSDTAAFSLNEDEMVPLIHPRESFAAIYFGTLGLLVEPMRSLGEKIVMESRHETLVVIDPNCRPSAIRDHDAYRSLVNRLCTRANVVKVSTEDLGYLFPEMSHTDAAHTLLGLGATCVVLTDGSGPVTAFSGRCTVVVEVPPTEVVDTVGAGDALVGAFMRWWTGHSLSTQQLLDPSLLESALSGAVEISRQTCRRLGAQTPRREEARALEGWGWI